MSINFTSLLKDIILEASRYENLANQYLKPPKKGVDPKMGKSKAKMNFETFVALVSADPTSKVPNGIDIDTVKPEDMSSEKVKIGKYTQWLLKNFVTPTNLDVEPDSPRYKGAYQQYQELFMEDLYKVTGDLMKFERFKNRLPQEYRDINKLTPETLYDQVKDFSLEKTKATADEKKEASKTYQHPGAEIVYRGSDWTVAKISDQGQLGKDAACFYGGHHLESHKGETRWCTSSPGLTYFDRYIKDGPLYVVIPNSPKEFKNPGLNVGEKSGLPAFRYQFHFPSGQFMDPDDRNLNLVDFLNTNEEGLKQYFKPEFMKSLTDQKGEKVIIDYPSDSTSKFIALYGFDEFFATLPSTLKRFTFKNTSDSTNINLNLPNDISRFKELQALNFVNCIASIPESICSLENLQYLSLVDNKNLQRLPECLGDMRNLMVLNIPGSENKNIIPQSVFERAENDEDFNLFT